MPVKDEAIIEAMRDYSVQYPRYSARRMRIFLRSDGIVLDRDWAARILAAAKQQVPAKKPRRRYRSKNRQPFVATVPNQVWEYSFVFDGCSNSKKSKCLTMIDKSSKESLCINISGSIRHKCRTQVLEQLIKERGCPIVLSSDDGPEFVSIAFLQWAADRGLRNLLNKLGKLWQNRTNEIINGKFRDESMAMN